MTPREEGIHKLLLREGYAALNYAEQKLVDSLMVVC